MAYSIEVHAKAIALRESGYSIKEIARELFIAKSTASLWVGNVVLDRSAKTRLATGVTAGQLAAACKKRKFREEQEQKYFEEAKSWIKFPIGAKQLKLLCAMTYWCEGAKNSKSGVRFINSDPDLIRKFLDLFRASFKLDESRFRVCVHLHEYHDTTKQLIFWSRVANIKLAQFIKPYLKPHTGKRIKNGYNGCASIYYNDVTIQRRLLSVAKAYLMGV